MISCGYCGNEAYCIPSIKFYGKDYDCYVWHCHGCDAYVGTHKGTKTPLGTLANKELRDLRIKAHAIVDSFWKSRIFSRTSVYKHLGEFMKLKSDKTHIGMFDEIQCEKVIADFKCFMILRLRQRNDRTAQAKPEAVNNFVGG